MQYVSGHKLFVCAGFFCCTFAFGHFDHNKPNLYEQCVDKLCVIYFIRKGESLLVTLKEMPQVSHIHEIEEQGFFVTLLFETILNAPR